MVCGEPIFQLIVYLKIIEENGISLKQHLLLVKDEFISRKIKKFAKLLNSYNLNYGLIEYDGTHKIIEEVLIDYIQKYEQSAVRISGFK